MRILLTNDDGFDSEGLQAVADLFKDGHDVRLSRPIIKNPRRHIP